ncbi:uncharacterized protein LOC127137968 [Lathyrus oleraceus]|uniref:uncharacterized protein LOC127137968 n=1 Tax=Pisum sativum TaxID=3888 RepID=UPI0021D0FF7A|nr:uncharacterized protein LOC127137968 [Pisum sativum]
MDCERGGNYKRKNTFESSKSSNGTYNKCPFRVRSTLSGSDWKVMVWCGFHNHKLSEDLDDHDILDRLKVHERQFVNDMTKYNMTPWYTISSLKDKDPENLTSVIQVYKARATYSARFAYSEHEREKNFKWTLEKLKELFSSEKFLPTVVVTNRELPLMNGREKWMTIPDMGYPIACRCNVVFVSLSKRLTIIFFPLTLAPPMYTSRHKIIDVGFANDDRWIQNGRNFEEEEDENLDEKMERTYEDVESVDANFFLDDFDDDKFEEPIPIIVEE